MSHDITPNDSNKPGSFLAGDSAASMTHHAQTLNPIAERAAAIGLDVAVGELVEALTTDQRLALGKLASIMRSNEPHITLSTFKGIGLGDAGLRLVTVALAQVLGWKGETIQ